MDVSIKSGQRENFRSPLVIHQEPGRCNGASESPGNLPLPEMLRPSVDLHDVNLRLVQLHGFPFPKYV